MNFVVQKPGDKDVGMRGETSAEAKLRLLFVSSSCGDGGADRYPVRLAAALQARGAALTFACPSRSFVETNCQACGVATIPFKISNGADSSAARLLAQEICERAIDVVHAHARRDFVTVVWGVALARRELKRRNLPLPRLVLHAHLLRSLGDGGGIAGRFFRKGADAVVAVSEQTGKHVRRTHFLSPDFVRVISNGVDEEDYAEPGSLRAEEWRRALRAEWKIPDDALVIGMVGRLRRKGQDFLLDAAPEILARYPSVWIVLVGPERAPGDVTRLRKVSTKVAASLHIDMKFVRDSEYYRVRAKAGGIEERVVLTGSRNDIPAVMAAFDILAHLPTDEAFGLVLVEAMASGLPIVASNVGGCREVLDDNNTGLLVRPGDRAGLINALESLLNGEGAARRATLGATARSATAPFSFWTQLEKLERLYGELCASKAGRTL